MKTHVIHMSDELSVKMTNDAVVSLNKFNIEYELFAGIKGKAGYKILKDFGVVPSSYVHDYDWTDGTIGCLTSHYILWDICANQDQPFLIMEQDAVVVRDPIEILDSIESICHLDAYLPFENQNKDPDYKHIDHYNANIEKYEPGVHMYPRNRFYESRNITGSVFRGAYGYIITPKGAREVLSFIKKHGAFQADACLCQRASPIQRANSTYVRLNPYFETLDIQRTKSLRKPLS